MLNSICGYSSVAFSFSHSAYDGDYEIIPICYKLTAPMVVIRYSKEECIHLITPNEAWWLCKLLQHGNRLTRTVGLLLVLQSHTRLAIMLNSMLD